MNTPKYYIGQKVIIKNEEKWRTVVDIEYCETELVAHDDKPEYGYCYTLDNGKAAFWYELTRPPAKLEFGYCAMGDVVESEHGIPIGIIQDVRNVLFAKSEENPHSHERYFTYEEADAIGWKIKEEDWSEAVDIPENFTALDDGWSENEETITLNGKTYKLVE